MASLLTITPILFLLFTAPCHAQHPENAVAVPANFPKAFVTAMVVAIVCVVILVVLVCVLSHCWQYIIGLRWRPSKTGSSTSLVPERWLEPVFEWPQKLTPRRHRNNMKRKNRQRKRLGLRLRDGRRRTAVGVRGVWDQERRNYSQEGMLRGWE
ncbi:hypothetical protein F4818DRAFT_436303 [Hypoxylon cercidicola]|nr:hypothetical protein F4818DRAFT_436303 [Hypoxylon cercidicola]